MARYEGCKDLVGKKVRVLPGSFLFLPQTHCKFRRGEIRSWFKLGFLTVPNWA